MAVMIGSSLWCALLSVAVNEIGRIDIVVGCGYGPFLFFGRCFHDLNT